MILLLGISSESPLERVADALSTLQVPFQIFHQRSALGTTLEVDLRAGQLDGRLWNDEIDVRLSDVSGVYLRMMGHEDLPEVRALPADAPERERTQDLHQLLGAWADQTPARVVNRYKDMASNSSKPYQAQLILSAGFSVPDTLVTTSPDAVLDFRKRHRSIIFKSVSGIRSIVREFTDEDLPRLGAVGTCPTQFQERVEGFDVRVHVVGADVFGTRVHSEAVDYRYATQQVGRAAHLEAFELDPDTSAKCVALAARLNLPVAGIDLRMCSDGRVVCFEVNPSPGFSYYESHTGQPIALAIARFLAGRSN